MTNLVTRLVFDYRGGRTTSTFTAPNGTSLTGFPTDRGIKADGNPDCWNRFIGQWEIQGNKARTTGSGGQTIGTEAFNFADIDISTDISATVGAGFRLRIAGSGFIEITLEFPTARVRAYEIFGGQSTTKLTGTTTITSGTTYTLRVVTVGSGYTVYLNGNVEGTFTSTVNQTATDHRLVAENDTAARFDNYIVAKHNSPGATAYSVRNYDGDIVASGSVTDDFIDIPDALLKQHSNRGPYGWYRVYLTGPDHGDGQWGTAYGDCAFMRIPNSNLPTNGTPTQQAGWQLQVGNSPSSDEIARGVMGMGTSRYSIQNSAIPAATTIADMLPAVTLAKTWQTDTASPARPRKILIAFPNGTQGNEANITAIVNGLKAYVKVWECRNEPNFGFPAATWVPNEYIPFANAVHAADPTATVLGPGNVSFNDTNIGYFSQFLQAGGGAVTDAFSLHPYNCYNGDLALTRFTLGYVKQVIEFIYGLAERDWWMTEQGFGWNYAGLIYPRYAARWTALMYFGQEVITHGRMRPETTAYWYDIDIGFQTFPMQWLTGAGPGPTPGPVRTMEAELWNKTFLSEFDFGDTVTYTGLYNQIRNGSYAQNLYIGGTWSGADGTKVVGLMAASAGARDVLLDVTGGSDLTCVDPWGNTFTITAIDGRVAFPIVELPQWIRCPVGVTVTPVAMGLTSNLATTATLTTDAASKPGSGWQGGGTVPLNNTNIGVLTNGLQENQHASYAGTACQLFDPALPMTITLTWPSTIQANRVIVHCYPPWQTNGVPIAWHVDTWDGATWTTRYTKTRPASKSFAFTSGIAKCTYETYWDEQWILDASFLTVATTKIRLVVDDATWQSGETGPGGAYDALWGAMGAGPGGGPAGTVQVIDIREIEVFNDTGAPAPDPLAPRGRNPAMGGVLR